MSKFSFDIRPVAAADLAALHAVREAAFAPVFRSFRSLVGSAIARLTYANAEDGQGAWLDQMCNPDSRHRVHVAISDDRVVGFCGHTVDTHTQVGEIGLNAVHPDFAGRGIGTALYENALKLMREDEMEAATVATGGDPSHAPARRAYAKAGFCAAIPSVHLSQKL